MVTQPLSLESEELVSKFARSNGATCVPLRLGHASQFSRACATGNVGKSRAAAAAEEGALLTRHVRRELAPYLPTEPAAMS
jgi:hypothetical protein